MAGLSEGQQPLGDYGTPEQQIPATGMPGVDWETCMTMNDTWGFKRDDHNWKSTEKLLRNLIDIASKGGNYLLNVGPTPQGTIPDESVQRLAEIGKWMHVNGEAIYSSTASPFRKLSFGRCTRKPGKLFLEVFDWPTDGKLVVPMSSPIDKAYLLVDPSKTLGMQTSESGATIDLPQAAPDPIASVVVLETASEPKVIITPSVTPSPDGTILLSAASAEISGGLKLEAIEGGEKNIGYWKNTGGSALWDVQFNTPGTYSIQLNLSCKPEAAGGEYVITAGDQKVVGKVAATKSWSDFQMQDGGKLTIEKPGVVMITIKARQKPAGEALMNLRSILLRPSMAE
jgi:alpha-L-fucosidase